MKNCGRRINIGYRIKGWTDLVEVKATGQVVFQPDSVPRALAEFSPPRRG